MPVDQPAVRDLLGYSEDPYPLPTTAPPGQIYCSQGVPVITPRPGFSFTRKVWDIGADAGNWAGTNQGSNSAQANTLSNAGARPLEVVLMLAYYGRVTRSSTDYVVTSGTWELHTEIAVTEYATGATAVRPIFRDYGGLTISRYEFITPALQIVNRLIVNSTNSGTLATNEEAVGRAMGRLPDLQPGRTYRFEPNTYPVVLGVGTTTPRRSLNLVEWTFLSWPSLAESE